MIPLDLPTNVDATSISEIHKSEKEEVLKVPAMKTSQVPIPTTRVLRVGCTKEVSHCFLSGMARSRAANAVAKLPN
jgi:hypothetical protein